jgi:hypothetical protein
MMIAQAADFRNGKKIIAPTANINKERTIRIKLASLFFSSMAMLLSNFAAFILAQDMYMHYQNDNNLAF